MAQFLIVEDNAAQRAALEEFLGALGKKGQHQIYSASEIELARAVISERNIDIVLSDLMLPDGTGIDLVREVRSHARLSEIPILILTGQPSIETAVEAIREGASDYLLKPVDLTVLRKKIEALLENTELKTENRQLRQRISDTFQTGNLIGASSTLRDVLERLKQVAPADVTVLIEGESGTGKELIANLIHENSPRAGRPFIKVNCGALAKSILESELFGAVKGAYTGADRDRAGYFEAANGGTLFLDEIGEMDAESQVRLLRVIEEREVVRIGSTKAIPVDVRLIAATNRSLLEEVDHGRFREDLYYRLAVIRLFLPPLRQRSEDIPLLFNYFVTQFNDRYGKSVRGLSAELQAIFQNYDWPGNIREFRNVLEGMVVLARDDVLQRTDLPAELLRAPGRATGRKLSETITAGVAMEDYEKAIIERNLHFHNGNREQTARALGISERTLYRKIKDYNL